MNDEARAPPGLDPGHDRRPGRGVGSAVALRLPAIVRTRTAAAPTYAALDLGTNNCRLLVARPTGDGFRVIDAFSRIVRLGEGMSASGRLSEAAIGRAVEALAICRDKMRNRGVTRARLIATEACRAAGERREFLERVRERGRARARNRRPRDRGAARRDRLHAADRSRRATGVILFDIGGGSSELVRLGRSIPATRGPPHAGDRGLGVAAGSAW